jgi:mannose-6-phosphate isomerase-like protein (cupin superfamily)
MTGTSFERVNLGDVALSPTVAHHGDGDIRFARIAATGDTQGACNFIDLAVLPPGTSIGRHRHGADEEEFYLVLNGSGRMHRDGEEFPVAPGDLIRNRPGGSHGLVNTGPDDLRIFVFEVAVEVRP